MIVATVHGQGQHVLRAGHRVTKDDLPGVLDRDGKCADIKRKAAGNWVGRHGDVEFAGRHAHVAADARPLVKGHRVARGFHFPVDIIVAQHDELLISEEVAVFQEHTVAGSRFQVEVAVVILGGRRRRVVVAECAAQLDRLNVQIQRVVISGDIEFTRESPFVPRHFRALVSPSMTTSFITSPRRIASTNI